MLTRDQLIELYRTHQQTRVLSIYVNADQHDPAQRDAWRIRLKGGLSQARDALDGAPHDESKAFDAAQERIRAALDADTASSFLPGRGWVGFATADALIHTDRIDVPMPDLVRWERGLRIAPYVRALKQTRPVLLVVLDRRKAAVYRYQEGELTDVDHLHADTFVGDLTDIGTAKRATNRSGIRGKTGTDAAQNVLDTGARRLVQRLIDELEIHDGQTSLVIGGTREQMSALRGALPADLQERLAEDPSLNFDMGRAELAQRVEAAASELSSQRLGALLDDIAEKAGAHGDGCLGREATEKALREGRVRTLAVSVGLQERDPDLADRLIGTAFGANGADAHLLPRAVGERLDRMGEGVGALLHYHVEAGSG